MKKIIILLLFNIFILIKSYSLYSNNFNSNYFLSKSNNFNSNYFLSNYFNLKSYNTLSHKLNYYSFSITSNNFNQYLSFITSNDYQKSNSKYYSLSEEDRTIIETIISLSL